MDRSMEQNQIWYRKKPRNDGEDSITLVADSTGIADKCKIWVVQYDSGRTTELSEPYIRDYFDEFRPMILKESMTFPALSIPKQLIQTMVAEQIQQWVGQAVAQAFENGARAYAAVDPCCGTYHLHEIINPHTGEPIETREGDDDL